MARKKAGKMAAEKSMVTEEEKTIEMFEIKKSLNFMSGEIATIVKQQKTIMGLMGEIQELKRLNEEKDKKINMLETRVEDLEQYSRINDVIISGLDTRHRSYASTVAARTGEDPPEKELISLEQQVLQFFTSKGISVEENGIEGCHSLPRKNQSDKPTIVMRFVNRKHKNLLLKQGRKLRGTNVYVNDHLTKKNADIARKARYLRKLNKIQATWVRNCKVFVKLLGSPEEAKVLVIHETAELDKYM